MTAVAELLDQLWRELAAEVLDQVRLAIAAIAKLVVGASQ